MFGVWAPKCLPQISSLRNFLGLYPTAGAKSFATRFPPARLPIDSREIQPRNKNSFGPVKDIDKPRVNLILVTRTRKGHVCVERFKVRGCGKSFALIGVFRDRVGGKRRILDCGWCLIYQPIKVGVLELILRHRKPNTENVPPLRRDVAVPWVSSHCSCFQGRRKSSARIFPTLRDPSWDEMSFSLQRLGDLKINKAHKLHAASHDQRLTQCILGDSSASLCAVEGTAEWHPHLESSVRWIVFKGHIFSPFQVLIVSSRPAVQLPQKINETKETQTSGKWYTEFSPLFAAARYFIICMWCFVCKVTTWKAYH